MSDSPDPTPPQNNPNRSPGDANGFNWRMLALFAVASVILGLAFFGPSMNKSTKTLTYSQFRQAWDQGRIVTDDEKRPLKVITSDTAYDATIVGYEIPAPLAPQNAQVERSDFRVLVDLDLQGGMIRDVLGDDVQMQQIDTNAESPLEGDVVQTLSLPELRKAYALGQIKTDDAVNPLRILTTPGSRNAVIVGTRQVRSFG